MERVEGVGTGDGALILVDLFGASPLWRQCAPGNANGQQPGGGIWREFADAAGSCGSAR